MCGRTAGGDQCGADAHLRRRIRAQPVQGFEQRLEGAGWQGRGGVADLVVVKGAQPLAGVDLLGLVREQHGVAVEGDAHFIGVGFGPLRGLRVDAGGREAGLQRGAHVVGIGRQKEMRPQRLQVGVGRTAAGEHTAFQWHTMMVGRAEGTHAAGGIVARQQHHVHAPFVLAGAIEGQQFLDQRHGHAALGRQVQQVQLAGHVGMVVALLEEQVLLLEVEEGAGRDGDDQLVVWTFGHGCSGRRKRGKGKTAETERG